MRFVLMIRLLVLPTILWADVGLQREQIQQRIQPIGQVRLQADAGIPTLDKQNKQEIAKVAGQDTYEKFCTICHQDGIAGAPKFQMAEDWKARFAKGDINLLVKNAMQGVNAMPAKGACSTCNEADIKAAVEYMVPPHE